MPHHWWCSIQNHLRIAQDAVCVSWRRIRASLSVFLFHLLLNRVRLQVRRECAAFERLRDDLIKTVLLVAGKVLRTTVACDSQDGKRKTSLANKTAGFVAVEILTMARKA